MGEKIGATDSSVEAAWDHLRDDWREDVTEVSRELALAMLRWGGIFLDFYRFAKAMRRADPSIQLIGWGDSGWAGRMIEAAGEHLQFLAFHHMFNPDSENQPVLRGELYRRDAEATWQQLMKAWKINDKKIRAIRENLGKHTMPPYSLPLFSYRLKSAATAPIYRSQPRDSTAPNASPFGCK